MIVVRPIDTSDADEWVRMRHALWPDEEVADLSREVGAFFKGNSKYISAVFIALTDGKPAGFIELNIRPYAEGCQSSPVPHVEGWYVAAHARRRGVGRKLMAAAEAWATEHGYTELTSDTTEAYPDSVPAHIANGFEEVERLIAFRKNL